MNKKMLISTIFVTTIIGNTAFAAHWLPLVEGTDRVPAVMFDGDSVKKTSESVYFWEKVQKAPEEYQLRIGRVSLRDFAFADAEVARKEPGQKLVYMNPQEWEEHGSSMHPLRLAWMDKVLKQADGADIVPAEVQVENVKVPENLQ